MTTIAEIKSALHQLVANTEDEKTLKKMQAYFQSITKKNKKIVAYDSKFKPLTASEYRSEVQGSIVQYRKRKVVSQKEMEKKL